MKAVVKFGKGKEGMELRDVPKPVPKDNELLVKVLAAGICGTDLHIMKDEYPHASPVIPGHEYTGIIEAMGKDVVGFAVGDQITSFPAAYTCGTCRYCREGVRMLCTDRKSIGSGVDGAMAEYVVTPYDIAFKIPDNMKGEMAAMSEPAGVGVRAVLERAKIQAGDTVLVVGPGLIGQMTAQMAKIAGAFVIMSGTPVDEARLKLARDEIGIDVIVSDSAQLMDAVEKYSPGGVDYAFECVGINPTLDSCFKAVRRGGNVVLMGVFADKYPLDAYLALAHEVNVISSNATAYSTWELLMKLYGQNKVKLAPFAKNIYSIDDWSEAFDAAERKEGFKILIKP